MTASFKVTSRDENGCRIIAISGVDSSGIAILIQGLKLAQKEEVDYRLLDPSTQVRAVIELAQLQQLFTVETSGGSE
jgi:anti-anti-sigma factor